MIDYALMNKRRPAQKAALTKATKKVRQAQLDLNLRATFDTRPVQEAREALLALIKKTIAEWNECGAWPDDWHRWQNALDDALPFGQQIDIRDL